MRNSGNSFSMYTTYLTNEKFRWYLLLFSISAIFSIVLIGNAWLNDDAYITFRVVDNFVNGYGLRWNVDERVQAYTNPLWLFVISAVYFFTREIYLTSIIVSILFSLVAIFILICFHSRRISQVLVGFSALAFSRSFVDYTTCNILIPTKISKIGFDKLRIFVYPRDVESEIKNLEIIESK